MSCFVGAHLEAVAGGVGEAHALLRDGVRAQRVADVEARVAHVEALVQALRAAADDDHLLAAQLLDAVELAAVHEAAAAELVQLLRHREGVEVVLSGHGVLLGGSDASGHRPALRIDRRGRRANVAFEPIIGSLYCVNRNTDLVAPAAPPGQLTAADTSRSRDCSRRSRSRSTRSRSRRPSCSWRSCSRGCADPSARCTACFRRSSSRRHRESARTGAHQNERRQDGSATLPRRRSHRRKRGAHTSRPPGNARPRRSCREPGCKPAAVAAGTGSCGTRTVGTPSWCSCRSRPRCNRSRSCTGSGCSSTGSVVAGIGHAEAGQHGSPVQHLYGPIGPHSSATRQLLLPVVAVVVLQARTAASPLPPAPPLAPGRPVPEARSRPASSTMPRAAPAAPLRDDVTSGVRSRHQRTTASDRAKDDDGHTQLP